MGDERRINTSERALHQIYDMLETTPEQWRYYLPQARSVITNLDSTTLMRQRCMTQEQVWFIEGLQRLAFVDPGGGGVTDIAAWCLRQWLNILQRCPENLAALRGLGQIWLFRAQPVLTRIYRTSSSSSRSSVASEQSSVSSNEAERRADTPDYVEARGHLLPAAEYLEQAVDVATAQQALTGDLLTMVSL